MPPAVTTGDGQGLHALHGEGGDERPGRRADRSRPHQSVALARRGLAMDVTALLLSRLQFAFTISFHIIFPVVHDRAGGLAHRPRGAASRDRAPGLSRGLRVLAQDLRRRVRAGRRLRHRDGVRVRHELERAGADVRTRSRALLLSYETFTAFFLEASFFGILLFGRSRVPPWFYLFSTAMVALGTTLSAFWIMVNNSWMQVPVGYVMENGVAVPTTGPRSSSARCVWVRFPHMLLAAYLTGAFCVAATGAWYVLRRQYHAEARIMLRMGLFLAAVLVPLQLVLRALRSAIMSITTSPRSSRRSRRAGTTSSRRPRCCSRCRTSANRRPTATRSAFRVLGSLIGSMSLTSKEVGLDRLPAAGPAAGADPLLRASASWSAAGWSCWRSPGSAPI